VSNDPRETKPRKWFSLTYEEIEAIEKQIWEAEVNSHRTPYSFAQVLAREIEKRLKERNNDGN
jgi:hypothetical protein